MGRRTGYPPGTFSWVELATTEATEAAGFYAALLGWRVAAGAAGPGSAPADLVCRLDGDAVCGIRAVPAGAAPAGAGATWTAHVTVADADAAAARAVTLGARVADGPAEAGEAGRLVVVEDPQGALLTLWQPRAWFGAERVNDVGCLCMNELVTPDAGAASVFYEGLFGWRTDVSAEVPDGPHMVFDGEAVAAAMLPAPPGTTAHWRPCFTVPSVVRSMERAAELGGRPVRGPVDIGDGEHAVVRDPQGAELSLFAGETDP